MGALLQSIDNDTILDIVSLICTSEGVGRLIDYRPYTLRRYGDRYKLVIMQAVNAGQRIDGHRNDIKSEQDVNTQKLDNNISRARSRVTELALCNDWDYFVTLTLDACKYNRYDLPAWRRAWGYWIGNYNRLNNCKLSYILIPEQHRDGAWHMHGLMSNIPPSALSVNGNGYLDWDAYARKFGYISLSKVRDAERVAHYISKYISKDMAQRAHDLGAHLYYATHGLNGAVDVSAGRVVRRSLRIDADGYHNDWVSIYWLSADEVDDILKGGGLVDDDDR